MAFRNITAAISSISKAEIVLRDLPKFVQSKVFETTFKQCLLEFKERRANRTYFFPLPLFQRFPQSVIQGLIKSSYDILNKKNVVHDVFDYNTIISTFLIYEFDSDLSQILNDMIVKNIRLNYTSFMLLLKIYSKQGRMDSVEYLFDIVKKNKFKIPLDVKVKIFGGYIKTGQTDKANQFLATENLDINQFVIMSETAIVYADVGDFDEVTKVIENMKTMDKTLNSKFIFNLYRRMVKAHVSQSKLDELINTSNSVIHENDVQETVFYLNRFGFYDSSLHLIVSFPHAFVNDHVTPEIITSFNCAECPTSTYKVILEKLVGQVYPDIGLNLFANMVFNEAYTIIQSIETPQNIQCLLSNLLVKAINDKSVDEIELCLRFGVEHMNIKAFNSLIQFAFLPTLMKSDMVKNADEILELLPQQRELLLPPLLLYFLTKGDFASFESLADRGYRVGDINHEHFSFTNAKQFLNNVSFTSLQRLVSVGEKMLPVVFVNWLVVGVVVEKILRSVKLNDIDRIESVIKMAKEMGVNFDDRSMEYLERKVPKYFELCKQLKRDYAIGITKVHEEKRYVEP